MWATATQRTFGQDPPTIRVESRVTLSESRSDGRRDHEESRAEFERNVPIEEHVGPPVCHSPTPEGMAVRSLPVSRAMPRCSRYSPTIFQERPRSSAVRLTVAGDTAPGYIEYIHKNTVLPEHQTDSRNDSE